MMAKKLEARKPNAKELEAFVQEKLGAELGEVMLARAWKIGLAVLSEMNRARREGPKTEQKVIGAILRKAAASVQVEEEMARMRRMIEGMM